MDGFQILKLPHIPRTKALKLLQPIELFELSLCSTKALELVRDLRIEALSHEIHLNRGSAVISVKFPVGKKIIWWDFKPFYNEEYLFEQRTIGRIVFDKCIKSTQPLINVEEFYCNYHNIERGMIAVTEHLTSIFKGPVIMNIFPRMINELSFFLSRPHLKRCQSLEITGDEVITKNQMKQIFGNVIIYKKLIIRPETEVEYPIPHVVFLEHLELQTACWMHRYDLLQLNSRFAELRDNNFTSKDMREFGEKWQYNKRSKLERVWFGWAPEKELILDGIKTIRWDPSKRERNYILMNNDGSRQLLDCGDGIDLERDDGELATFLRDNNPLNPGLYFVVWKEKFPEKKRLDELPITLAPYYKQLEEINKQYPNAKSLERMLSNPSLKYNEFLETYQILRSMDHEYHPLSIGRSNRRRVFDRMFALIDIDNNL